MFVHRSNQTEELACALADVVARPLPSALTPEVIVVSSQGMERWLSQNLATHFGVWANARFPFPRAFVAELLDSLPATEGNPKAFARESLTWTIADLLPEIARRPGAEALASYLRAEDQDAARFGLAREIADVFDQYTVYRPELVLAWERGAGRGWQPDLWRAIVARHGSHHVAARAARFLAGDVPSLSPARVSIFGASALPRIYVRLFAHLARLRDVHVFLLTPSPEPASDHPLARSLGALARDFEQILLEEAPDAQIDNRFVKSRARTMLETVHADLFAGQKREAGSVAAPRVVAKPEDGSIVVHSCHGALREVEVLRDQLRAAFEDDPTLEPRDVIVMAADIDRYAPLVDAVFGVSPDDPGFIPYRVADRKVASSNLVAEALLSVLDLAGGRMRASDVLDLLQLEPVRDRFEIAEEDLSELRWLVRESGIRWGIDAEHRARVGLPAREDNTWRFGLNRLLFGQVMGESDAPLGALLPVFARGRDSADLIGKLAEATRLLFDFSRELDAERTPSEWREALQRLLETFVCTEEPHVAAARAVRTGIDALFSAATDGKYEKPVQLGAITEMVRAGLGSERAAQSFLTGGVTFCALLPMRSVPFRVVCMLGLNDTEFPRRDSCPAFDLVAHSPEVGDRSSREEDRQLFLESVLSARERLLLFYEGRAVQDNAELPPSVVVAELLDLIDGTFATARDPSHQLALPLGSGVRHRVVTDHPLQSFNPRYFGDGADPRLFSFVEADAEGARALATGNVSRSKFHGAPLVSSSSSTIDLDDFARFLENPSRGLIQRRLGVVLEDEPIVVSNREAIELAPLPTYEVGARLFAESLRRPDFAEPLVWARGMGALPLGVSGDIDADRVLEDVRALNARARSWLEGGRLSPVEIAVSFDDGELTGVLRDVYPKAQVFVRFARLKARNELGAWVRHLALCASPKTGVPSTTVLLGRATAPGRRLDARVFEPLEAEHARTFLFALQGLYRLGQQAPLSLFPAASRRFMEALVAGEDERSALAIAKKAFTDRRMAGADGDDAYVRRLFEDENPFDTELVPFDEDGKLGLPSFSKLARAVFEPLLAASRLEPG